VVDWSGADGKKPMTLTTKYRIRDGDESVIANLLTCVTQEMKYWQRACKATNRAHTAPQCL
jgi:hypothetical protein